MALFITKSDSIGVLSSGLCLLHCLATPFLFVSQTHISQCFETKPIWWSSIDFIFIIVSAVAIYRTVKTTTRQWIKIALWINWFIVLVLIINEKMGWLHLSESFIYFPAGGLIFFHIYNSKYCQCKNGECCVNKVFE
ncbi:hypothetical protein A8C32_02415 [Flavivirga aquatica]|uniref:MerC mercury resistance protein n=1 Tax=Flavivirga aquatica TaxID=1849968 RepID=A0A1E5TAA6_9FLAO|nr:MerC domain-containing protein [Flavivirga aquatica]OEK08325.1 hypothetical protein A8C32_02415 [Flavivirga aquatica]